LFCYTPSILSLTRSSPPLTPPPYTTLFRSCRDDHEHQQAGFERAPTQVEAHQTGPLHAHAIGTAGQAVELAEHGEQHHGDRQVEDRKSTRLNSSHVKISYAVFCLKKIL